MTQDDTKRIISGAFDSANKKRIDRGEQPIRYGPRR
jgi:hypothetical protein